MLQRPRRNRASQTIRDLVAETHLKPSDFVWPLFLTDGTQKNEPISAMPGVFRSSVDVLIPRMKEACAMGLKSFALFPKVSENLKNADGAISLKESFFLYSALRKFREEVPEATLITDVALDPY